MIASELALELQIEAGILSKRLKLYFGELDVERPKTLPAPAIEHMRKVDHLLRSNQAVNTRTAVQMVLGKHVEAAPPSSVVKLEHALIQLSESQQALHLKLDQLLATHFNKESGPLAPLTSAILLSDETNQQSGLWASQKTAEEQVGAP